MTDRTAVLAVGEPEHRDARRNGGDVGTEDEADPGGRRHRHRADRLEARLEDGTSSRARTGTYRTATVGHRAETGAELRSGPQQPAWVTVSQDMPHTKRLLTLLALAGITFTLTTNAHAATAQNGDHHVGVGTHGVTGTLTGDIASDAAPITEAQPRVTRQKDLVPIAAWRYLGSMHAQRELFPPTGNGQRYGSASLPAAGFDADV
ncbi:hypothetical protein [Streptomyces sp. NPDC001502]|uniref:hypothetical protein n=1 Tax=Streptomyces sp. NPDC001502 TaxID=3364578 RepID=UPI0036B80269